MQTNNKKEIMVAGLFTALFLLGGLIHVFAGPLDFTSCIAQIYYSSLVLIWAVTVNYRIVNKRVRRLMLTGVALFMLAFFLQMCRYRIFESFLTACRYFWYGYYIPVVMVPVVFLFVVLHLHLQEDEKPHRRWLMMLIPAILLVLLVMTNDLHQLVFRFPNGVEGITGKTGTYTHEALFYGIYGWFLAVLMLAVGLSIKQCRLPNIGKKLWMPLYFAGFGILLVFSMFDTLQYQGVIVWLLVECLAMIVIGIEESCIQLGLIPANSSYRTVARLANKPVIIADEKGTPIYTAASSADMFQNRENVEIHTKPIKGGSVTWAVDLSERMSLNREIEETTKAIESRNEYLRNENALKEEQTAVTARNMLYNHIAEIVQPQLDEIALLLEHGEDKRNLAKIAFLNAYIKRRSNMELLKSDRKSFPTEELASAIRESCEYLKLCDVNAMLYITPERELGADTQLFLYEAFETVVENCLDTLELLLVNITMQGTQPVLRMTLKASAMDMKRIQKQLLSKGATVCSFTEADEDVDADEMTLHISRQEGWIGQ